MWGNTVTLVKGSVQVLVVQTVLSLPQCLPEDVLNPVDVQVAFSFEGVPIKTENSLVPQLDTSSSQTTEHKVPTDSK